MSIRRHLERSASGSEFVRVIRRGRHLDKLDGVVVSLGRKWLAMALDDDAGFDGFAVIRSRDVCRVEPLNNGRFLRDSWALQGHWPVPYVGDVVLERTREMLPGLSRLFPVLTMHYEYDDPHACLIGVPLRCRRHSFTLQTIDPDAQWNEWVTTFRYPEVSRVDVATAYSRRLLDVGGPPPAREG